MRTLDTVRDLRAALRPWREAGDRIALVPTMGALHKGHLGLIARARAEADRILVSIFVNPTQFGPGEDFAAYPRDLERDAVMLARAGTDLVFAPGLEVMYPPGFATRVTVEGLTDRLCGAIRPGHFEGVAQVVTKLFIQALPDCAVFGEKDWQQLVVIRRLVRDLDLPVAVLGAPIAREADGLAMSSRNRYLRPGERDMAGHLPRILSETAAAIAGGAAVESALAEAQDRLARAGIERIDYVELAEAETLAPLARLEPGVPARLFAAVRVGPARLIDNWPVEPPA